MPGHEAGDRLARLLLPYCRRKLEDVDGPDNEVGWWFAGAPPDVAREALALVHAVAGERPNDQPPEEWLVAQATHRGGVLAGFVAPARPASPRMRVDAIIVPCSQAEDLASEIARLWRLDDGGTALDFAIVEGLACMDADRRVWGMPGSEFRPWRADAGDWLDATFCSFWWD